MADKRKKLLSSAQKHLQNRNWKKALKCYKKIVEENPKDFRARLKIADLFAKRDMTKRAVNTYEKVADHYARDSRFHKAVSVYKQALRIAPEAPTLHHKIGEAYYRLGRTKDAVRLFEDTFELYRQKDEFDKQIRVLKRIRDIDPDNVGVTIQLAELYTESEKYDDAGKLFKEAADQLEDEGRMDDFVAISERQIYCQNALNLDRRRQLIGQYIKRSELEKALEHIEVVLSEEPEAKDVLEEKATVLEGLDQLDEAVQTLRKLKQLVTDSERKAEIENWILEIAPGQTSSSPRATEERQNTEEDSDEDVLAGVQFLDDYREDEKTGEFEEVSAEHASQQKAQVSETPLNVDAVEEAQKTYQEYEQSVPDVDVDRMREDRRDDHDTVETEAEPVEAREEFSDLEVIDNIESADDDTASGALYEDELEEIESFIQFGLLDRAENSARQLIQQAPLVIPAHEALMDVYRAQGDIESQVDELLRMARETQTMPNRAKKFLDEALDIANDEMRVRAVAAELNIHL